MNITVDAPSRAEANAAFLLDWQKNWDGPCFCYEYHFWKHQLFDTAGLELAKRIYEDIEVYRENDINGLIACGSLRSFFPNGFAYYVFARKQYDASLTYEEILEDYYFISELGSRNPTITIKALMEKADELGFDIKHTAYILKGIQKWMKYLKLY